MNVVKNQKTNVVKKIKKQTKNERCNKNQKTNIVKNSINEQKGVKQFFRFLKVILRSNYDTECLPNVCL